MADPFSKKVKSPSPWLAIQKSIQGTLGIEDMSPEAVKERYPGQKTPELDPKKARDFKKGFFGN